jgi:hypothetical protein
MARRTGKITRAERRAIRAKDDYSVVEDTTAANDPSWIVVPHPVEVYEITGTG